MKKHFKWRIFIITGIVCLLPVLWGVSLWDKLPDTMAIHFNIKGEADGFASKEFVVFGLPVMMVALQWIGCIVNDLNAKKYGDCKKLDQATKWIIPFVTVVLYIATIGYGIGWNLDMRRVASFILGVVLIVTGNYVPSLDYVKHFDIEVEKARKINRFLGYETTIMGILFFISLFLPVWWSVACTALIIPCAVIGIIYGMIVSRR